ncbi:MAG TPA: hypothetical protein VN181_00090, partial [Thermoanaerobaculia bacterium]|nr:hypothetical protein [Thermoanaerobaculia bacterium]
TVWGLLVAAVQALINSVGHPFWPIRLPPSRDAFVIIFVFGVILTAIGALIGLIAGGSLGNWNTGLVCGLALGMLVNVTATVFALGRWLVRRNY